MRAHIPKKYGTQENANARIRELEALIGLPEGPMVEHIDQAWDRIEHLEKSAEAPPQDRPSSKTSASFSPPKQAPQKPPQGHQSSKPLSPSNPPIQTPQVPGKQLTGLARAIAANQAQCFKTSTSSPPPKLQSSSTPLTGLARAIAANQSNASKTHL